MNTDKNDILLRQDGKSWMAVTGDFQDLQNSPSYWGESPLEALQNMLYSGSRMKLEDIEVMVFSIIATASGKTIDPNDPDVNGATEAIMNLIRRDRDGR